MASLNAIERRVLGVLIEKSMTQPDYYPMSLNAVVTGCNQKSNRDPVMDLDEVSVSHTLDGLRKAGLVEQLFPAPGARTDRFKHKAEAGFGWGPRERAVMTELMLRGPQTLGELRTRCSRMVPFDSLDAVSNVIEALAQNDPPLAQALPREPGRSAIRYTHLLYEEDESPVETQAAPPIPSAAPSLNSTAVPTQTVPTAPAESSGEVDNLRHEIEGLQEELAELHEIMTELRRRIETLENEVRG